MLKKYKDADGWTASYIKEEGVKDKIDVFELYFNDSLSLFKPQESNLREKMSWMTSKNVVYQNLKSKERFTIKKIYGEELHIKDSLRRFVWKITDSRREIAGHNCRKAIWEANDSTKLYAWYSDQIINSIGPESFTGLPGAILGLATEDGGVVYFAKRMDFVTPKTDELLPEKTKKKIYSTDELRTKIENDFGEKQWGKSMLKEHFGIW